MQTANRESTSGTALRAEITPKAVLFQLKIWNLLQTTVSISLMQLNATTSLARSAN